MCRSGKCFVCRSYKKESNKAQTHVIEKRGVGQTERYTLSSGSNWKQAEKKQTIFGYANGKSYKATKTVRFEERDVGNIKELIAEQKRLSMVIEEFQQKQAKITAQLKSIKSFYIEKWEMTPEEADKAIEQSVQGGSFNMDKIKKFVNSGPEKRIAHSDVCGDFEVISNNGGGKNACLMLSAAGECSEINRQNILALKPHGDMLETGEDSAIALIRATLRQIGENPSNWYLKFFNGPINNLRQAGGHPLGKAPLNVMYIHNIDNVHFQRLKPVEPIRALTSVPEMYREDMAEKHRELTTGVYKAPSEAFEWY